MPACQCAKRAVSMPPCLHANNIRCLTRAVPGCAHTRLTLCCMLHALQVPLDIVDLSHVSILYTVGDMAAITPIYDYNFQVGFSEEGVRARGMPPHHARPSPAMGHMLLQISHLLLQSTAATGRFH